MILHENISYKQQDVHANGGHFEHSL